MLYMQTNADYGKTFNYIFCSSTILNGLIRDDIQPYQEWHKCLIYNKMLQRQL